MDCIWLLPAQEAETPEETGYCIFPPLLIKLCCNSLTTLWVENFLLTPNLISPLLA